ncbi:hypothetical protein [Aromatoleum bremense]|uniref:Uncharacterized protein n=1 Tax=Aromatoleum bremense TaxID=76115 RepID=A0ABX1NVV2_9RHOO|nr:hypothetical protein [Aromatoleum bremense]NMG16028.1 hypothetical protein [Aromatoleum bremense]
MHDHQPAHFVVALLDEAFESLSGSLRYLARSRNPRATTAVSTIVSIVKNHLTGRFHGGCRCDRCSNNRRESHKNEVEIRHFEFLVMTNDLL